MEAAGTRDPAPDELADAAPQIFISYAREDRVTAQALRSLLESEGWTVWWDQDIHAGAPWRTTLLDVLGAVQAVVVLWSGAAARSEWVAREVALAVERGVLVPCTLDTARPPHPLSEFQAARLTGWAGETNHKQLPVLFTGLERLARPVRLDAVRPGFDTRYLGREIELPVIPGVGDEFPYLHFSVVMNPARRLAWYVAYNVAPPGARIDRPDRWLADPTLSQSFQPTDEHFARTGFDRGHLVSPMTVAWGDGRRPGIAVRQSYFWTNTAPQSRRLNQGSWARLEQAERRLATEHGRLTGFSGPVLDDADPLHVVTDELRGRLHARRTFRLPGRFWKLAVWDGRGGTESAAWVADNDDGATVTEVSTERVEELTGLRFPDVVRSASPGAVTV